MRIRLSKVSALVLCLILLLQTVCIPAFAAEDAARRSIGTVGDPMVYLTQKWLNQEYGDVEGFGSVTENGKTGWETVYGLLRALQHELGITDLANSFGPSTTSLYSQNLLYRQDGVTDRKFAILQGALWCKGYSPGYKLYENLDGTVVFEEVFDDEVERAVIEFKTDAGFTSPDGVVTVNVMKALLSMDTFKLLSSYGGKAEVRQMQQRLNRKYEEYIGLIPCDGVYGRSTNKALIYALQAEELMPTSVANGNFGTTTKLCCPEIPYVINSSAARTYPGTAEGSYYTDAQISSITQLLQFALLVNGYGDGAVDGVFDSGTQKAVSDFQKEMAIPVTGKADITTWMSLLVSCGDASRPAIAADCATILTRAKAKTLYDNGYRYIGRYLIGTYNGGISKAVTREEAQIIFDAGLRFFPIYQTSANYPAYFTPEQGAADARKATEAANALGLPDNTIIYFAVDFDCLDQQITDNVIPYFKSVHEGMNGSGYRVGIYATRNACTRVSKIGYACSSFVGNMSSGFSGNLGFAMPDNWAFDQFATVTIGSGEGQIEIDKDGYSGRDPAVSQLKSAEVVLKDSSKMFTDIKAGAWYKSSVDYAVTHGIFNGTSATIFSPNGNITRAQFVQVLANISNVDTSDRNVKTVFSDVPSGKWYTSAVKWAYDNEIVTGVSTTEFVPNANITREQMCVMLVRYAQFKGLTLNELESKTDFADDSKISTWAKQAVYICQQADIVNGKGDNRFEPKATGTRAEAATIFTKFHADYIK